MLTAKQQKALKKVKNPIDRENLKAIYENQRGFRAAAPSQQLPSKMYRSAEMEDGHASFMASVVDAKIEHGPLTQFPLAGESILIQGSLKHSEATHASGGSSSIVLDPHGLRLTLFEKDAGETAMKEAKTINLIETESLNEYSEFCVTSAQLIVKNGTLAGGNNAVQGDVAVGQFSDADNFYEVVDEDSFLDLCQRGTDKLESVGDEIKAVKQFYLPGPEGYEFKPVRTDVQEDPGPHVYTFDASNMVSGNVTTTSSGGVLDLSVGNAGTAQQDHILPSQHQGAVSLRGMINTNATIGVTKTTIRRRLNGSLVDKEYFVEADTTSGQFAINVRDAAEGFIEAIWIDASSTWGSASVTADRSLVTVTLEGGAQAGRNVLLGMALDFGKDQQVSYRWQIRVFLIPGYARRNEKPPPVQWYPVWNYTSAILALYAMREQRQAVQNKGYQAASIKGALKGVGRFLDSADRAVGSFYEKYPNLRDLIL